MGTTIARLPGILTAGTRVPFEIAVSPPAPTYRVSVLAFDWVQADGGAEAR